MAQHIVEPRFGDRHHLLAILRAATDLGAQRNLAQGNLGSTAILAATNQAICPVTPRAPSLPQTSSLTLQSKATRGPLAQMAFYGVRRKAY